MRVDQIISTLEGCEILRLPWRNKWHPFRVRIESISPGGLRFATTSGYYLAALRAQLSQVCYCRYFDSNSRDRLVRGHVDLSPFQVSMTFTGNGSAAAANQEIEISAPVGLHNVVAVKL